MTDTFQELIADPPQTPPAVAPETKTATATAEPVKAAPSELDAAVKAAQAVVDPATVDATKLATSEAESALRQLADMGITPTTAPNLLQTAQNADKLVRLMKSDPAGFVSEIRRYDPDLADNLMEGVTDEYLRIHPPDQQTSSQSRGADFTDPRLSQLEQRIARFEAQATAEAAAKATKEVGDAYKAAQAKMIDKLPESIDSIKREFIRLKMDELVAHDADGLRRINTGSLVDLGKHFQTAVGRLTAETMASAEKTKQEREAVVAGTIKDVPSAAQAVTGTEGIASDPWDDNALALDTKKVIASLRRG